KAGTGTPPPPQPYMGVQGESESGAVKLTVITENGPAAKAGLQADDMVTAMDGQPVTNYEEWTESFAARKVGDKVKLTVKRGDETKDISVTLEARQTQAGGGGGRGGRGPTASRPYSSGLGGQIQNAQNQQGPDGVQTGGVYKSTDGGE